MMNVEQLQDVLVGGVSSPVRAFRGLLERPLIAKEGSGPWLKDTEERRFIDFCMSWGALLHGHAHPAIVERATKRLQLGSTFGMSTLEEGDLALKIREHMPSLERIRFVSTGTEATMSALRLARAATGRDVIVKFVGNYHGHSDSLLVKAGSGVLSLPESSSKGVTKSSVAHTWTLPYNDEEALKTLTREVAAVIVEPVAANMGVVAPTASFLKALREETQRVGALLIFDEVVTGFRVGLNGAQGLYNIKPDLTCLGKIIGGGFPAAAFGGRRELMEWVAPLGPVYQAGTLSGNPVAMAAGFEALRLAEKPGFYDELGRLTRYYTEGVERLLRKRGIGYTLNRVGSMFTFFFGVDKVNNAEEAKEASEETFRTLFRALLQEGVYLPPALHEASFLSSQHRKEEIDLALFSWERVLERETL